MCRVFFFFFLTSDTIDMLAMFIVANIKILGIILISQLIKGSKKKFFIKPNFRRKYQTSSSGLNFFWQKMQLNLRK